MGGGRNKSDGRIRYLKQQRTQGEGKVCGRGIFVTCNRGKEARAVVELRDLLERAAEELGYDLSSPQEAKGQARDDDAADPGPAAAVSERADRQAGGVEEAEEDFEAQMRRELGELNDSASRPPKRRREGSEGPAPARTGGKARSSFANRQTHCECLAFLSVPRTMDAVRLVAHVVSHARSDALAFSSRYVLRCTPVDDTCAANVHELSSLARRILAPAFGPSRPDPHTGVRFRLDVVLRQHHDPLTRTNVISTVADAIGDLAEPSPSSEETASISGERAGSPPAYQAAAARPAWKHRADIENPEIVVLVTVFKNVAGISVVRAEEYEGDAKRWNLQEIGKARDEKLAAGTSTIDKLDSSS